MARRARDSGLLTPWLLRRERDEANKHHGYMLDSRNAAWAERDRLRRERDKFRGDAGDLAARLSSEVSERDRLRALQGEEG